MFVSLSLSKDLSGDCWTMCHLHRCFIYLFLLGSGKDNPTKKSSFNPSNLFILLKLHLNFGGKLMLDYKLLAGASLASWNMYLVVS